MSQVQTAARPHRGSLHSIEEYRLSCESRADEGASWDLTSVLRHLAEQPIDSRRQARALLLGHEASPRAGFVNGELSAMVQQIEPGQQTSAHSHSFWHFYVGLSGEATVVCGSTTFRLGAGDCAYVPSFEGHRVVNSSSQQRAVVLTLMNLPSHLHMHLLVRREADQRPTAGEDASPFPEKKQP